MSARTGALALFGGWTGVDLAELGADEPLRYVQTEANRSALASFTTSDRNWTAGELAHEVGLGGRGPVVVGSPTEVADELERWVDEAGVDGFNLAYVTTPGTFVDFARHVVPEVASTRQGARPQRAGPPYGSGSAAPDRCWLLGIRVRRPRGMAGGRTQRRCRLT